MDEKLILALMEALAIAIDQANITEAVWSASAINDLPDSAFLYIEPGGTKDADGKTTPRSLRHFPVKDASGKVDLPHLRNALARIPQSKLSAEVKAAALKKARSLAGDAGVTVAAKKEARAQNRALLEADDDSLDARMSAVRQAVRDKYGDAPGDYAWAEVVFGDYVIVRKGQKLWRVDYTADDAGKVTLGGEPVEVRVSYTPVKEGAIFGPIDDSTDLLQEAAAAPSGKKWGVLIIEEGCSKNRNRYSRKVLKEGAPLYEGARMFMDHQEEPRRFGRSTRDVAGFLKGIEGVLMPKGQPGTQEADQTVFGLAATAVITKPAIRQELLDAYQEGKPDLFGLSHDVLAESLTVMEPDGAVYDVQRIESVRSVDLVTNPAAGGRLLRLVASDTVPHTLEKDGTMLKKMIEAIMASGNAALIDKLKALGQTPNEDQVLGIYAEALKAPAPDPAKVKQEGAAGAAGTGATEVKEAAKPAAQPPAGATQAGTVVTIQEAALMEALVDGRHNFLEASLSGCALPDAVKDHLRTQVSAQITAATDPKGLPSKTSITEAIAGQVALFGKLAEQKVVVPATSLPRAQVIESTRQKVEAALDDFFDPKKPARSFRNLYVEITGDTQVTGLVKEAKRLSEALDTTSWAQILGDSITRRMLREYQDQPQANWRGTIAEVVPVTDFRTQRRMRFGGYGNLPTVGQGAPYTALTSPTDEEATYAPSKRGGTETVTIEMIANDDVGAIRRIPARLAKAAGQTLYEFVFDFLRLNSVIYDTVALAAAGHGNNLIATALSATNLAAARLIMKQQTNMDNAKRLGINARYLFHPTDLDELAFQLTTSDKALPAANLPTQAEPAAPNFLKKLNITPITVDYWTDADNYWVTGSVADQPMIEIGFWGGETPELFVQDTPNQGSLFSNDVITYKIRHVYGGGVLDYRPFVGGIVP